MKMRISQRKNRFEAEVEDLEAKLQNALQPVTPRQAFIYDLRQQLENRPEDTVKHTQFSPQNMLVILASLLGAVVLVIFGAKGIRSLIQALNQPDQEKMSLPANPA